MKKLLYKICNFQYNYYIAITKLNYMQNKQNRYEQESFSPRTSYIIITIIILVALFADNLNKL